MEIQESTTKERLKRASNIGGYSGLETLRMQNFERKEKQRMNISLVN
jgi:hypothetical protein